MAGGVKEVMKRLKCRARAMGVREQHGVGAEKIIQQFKAPEVLPEDLGLVLRTHTEAKSHLYFKDRQFCLLDSVYT